jgi:hypothetical protein
MKSRVYIETTIVSYATSLPSRDLVQAAHQQITRDWWSTKERFELFASQFVIREASGGDPGAAQRRLEALRGITVLPFSDDAVSLSDKLIQGGGLPPTASVDAIHIAIAVTNGMDYLLTWNCKHIANAVMLRTIERICRAAGFEPPVICTPEELMTE